MLHRTRKLASGVCLVGAVSLGGGFWAHAAHASSTDTDDSISNGGSNVVATNNAPLTINVNTNSFGSFTATCTGVSANFNVPVSGMSTTLNPVGGQPIQITGCTDSLGGTDTISSSGTWKIKFKDVKGETETATEPNTGDKAVISVPLSGASLVSSVLPSCVLTLDKTTTSKLKLAYDDNGTGSIANNTNPGAITPGSGCPAGMTVTETLNSDTLGLSIPIHDQS